MKINRLMMLILIALPILGVLTASFGGYDIDSLPFMKLSLMSGSGYYGGSATKTFFIMSLLSSAGLLLGLLINRTLLKVTGAFLAIILGGIFGFMSLIPPGFPDSSYDTVGGQNIVSLGFTIIVFTGFLTLIAELLKRLHQKSKLT